VRLRLIRAGYQLAWLALWLTSHVHHSRRAGVKALLSHDGRILLVQHTYGPRRWELPGGGLHRGETPLDGIRREIREELSLELGDARLVAQGRQVNRSISVFAAELTTPAAISPDEREIARVQWYPADALPPRLGWQVAASVRAWLAGDAAPVELRRATRRGVAH